MTTTAATRQPTLAERFSPARDELEQYVSAIARRNTAWHHWRDAADLLAARQAEVAAGRQLDLRVYVRHYNDALGDYERAEYDLIRQRVRYLTNGVPWDYAPVPA